jgi:hypothetical protein
MGVVSNVNQALAWGMTPFWVQNQFNKSFKSGTGSYKDGWGSSHSYTIYGLSNISTGGGNTFNVDNWNGWSASQQGSQANLTYLNGGYGLAMNTGGAIISQNVGDITYGTPVLTSSQDVAQNAQGAALVSTIDNTQGSTPITQTITFEASETAESNTSTTQGFSNTTEISVGTEVSAEFAGIGASVNTSVTNSTTIDSSSSTGTSQSQTISNSLSNTYTVEPGYKIQVQMMYTNQQINMPYTAPVSISGTVVQSDQWGNTLTNTAGNAIWWSNYYGLTPNGVMVNANQGNLLATGVITNQNSFNFTTTQTTLVKPSSSGLLRAGLQSPEDAPLSDDYIPEVKLNGDVVEVGAMYDTGRKYATLKGSVYGDQIYMRGRGQIAYTHSGNDYVSGSEHADKIIVGSHDGLSDNDSDVIEANGGNDFIKVHYGAHVIDAGSGHDKIELSLLSDEASRVTLGSGRDHLTISLKSVGDDGSEFIVTDLTSEDKIEYLDLPNGSALSARVVGQATEVFLDGDHVGTFIHQDSIIGNPHGEELAELGLLNIDSILMSEGKNKSKHIYEWRDGLIESSVLGFELIKSYDQLIGKRKQFNQTVDALQEYVFGERRTALTKWAHSQAETYDSILDLTAAVINKASSYGLQDPYIPATFSDIQSPLSPDLQSVM